MVKDDVNYDEVKRWAESIDREELLQIITDIANRYYLPKTLVKDVRNVVYTNPDNDSNGFKMAGWLEKLMEEDDVNNS
jgi:hypothetical protein